MHFTVLSALPLPQDTSTAMNAVTVDDVVSFVAGKLLLENLASQKPVKMPEVDSAMIDSSRWECLVECMVDSLLAPYNENNTDIAHMEFDDHTDEGHTAYEQSGVDCVRTPDGNPQLSVAKCDALMEIKRRCCKYREIGFVPDLVLAVLEKKLELLKKADTIKDCNKIQAPSAPIYHQYSGDFEADDTWVAEEELIQWSLASLRTPLLPDVFKRFRDLFRQVFGVNI